MAEVSFTHDDKPPMDRRLEEITSHAENLQKPVRIRVQPDIYDHVHQNYAAWTGLVWMLELRDIEEARRLREGLANFFRVFGGDEKKQKGLLTELERRAVGVGR